LEIIGLIKLDEFKQKHTQVKKAVEAWVTEVQNANWQTPQDIKNRYRSADFLSGNRVIFDIKGNAFRLVTRVQFPLQIVMVLWIGTHAAYSKMDFR